MLTQAWKNGFSVLQVCGADRVLTAATAAAVVLCNAPVRSCSPSSPDRPGRLWVVCLPAGSGDRQARQQGHDVGAPRDSMGNDTA